MTEDNDQMLTHDESSCSSHDTISEHSPESLLFYQSVKDNEGLVDGHLLDNLEGDEFEEFEVKANIDKIDVIEESNWKETWEDEDVETTDFAFQLQATKAGSKTTYV